MLRGCGSGFMDICEIMCLFFLDEFDGEIFDGRFLFDMKLFERGYFSDWKFLLDGEFSLWY